MLSKLAENPQAFAIVISALSMVVVSRGMSIQSMEPNWEPVIVGITVGIVVWHLGSQKRQEMDAKDDLARLRQKTNQIEKENEDLRRKLDKN